MKKSIYIYSIVIAFLFTGSTFNVNAQSDSFQRSNAHSNEFYKNWILDSKKHPLIIYSGLDTFTISKQGSRFIVLKNETLVFYITSHALVDTKGNTKVSKKKNSITAEEHAYQIINDKDNLFIRNQDSKDVVSVSLKKKGSKNYFDIQVGTNVSNELLVYATFLKYAADIKKGTDWLYGWIGTL